MKKLLHHIGPYIIFFPGFGFVLAVFIYVFCIRQLPVTYTPADGKESSALVNNPYCGFYQLNGYLPAEEKDADSAYDWAFQICSNNPHELMLLEINLKNYNDGWLSQNACDQIDRILSACSDTGQQIILRFLYDWDGQAMDTEPEDRSIIENHIRQLSSIVNAHTDCVYIMQGAFTGNVGEMNSTHYGSDEDMTALVSLLDECIDKEIFLSVRTPAQLRTILKRKTPLTSTEAYSGSFPARLGLFNDGMLGSVFDLGTYDDTPFEDPSDYTEKGTREEELDYQNRICEYVPNGGEVTLDNEYNNIEPAVADLRTMHVSYLNDAHDLAVLDKWKNSSYTEDPVFSGCNGYDYVEAHLGYRYVLTDSSLDFHSLLSDTATLFFTIENTGFAPAYKQFEVTLTAANMQTGKEETIATALDNRGISGSDSSIFHQELNIRKWNPGTYEITLSMKDPVTGKIIHFANENETENDSVSVGTLRIK